MTERMNPWRSWWSLAQDVHFYNHGSFGACPTPLLEKQLQWRLQLEQEPVRFMNDVLPAAMQTARDNFARFLQCQAKDLVVVANATTAVNTVLRTIPWQSGDQIVMTNHGYPACNAAAQHIAQQSGVSCVIAKIPFPLQSSAQIVHAVLSKLTARTRLVMLDHVTSPTGIIFPLDELIPELTARGIEVLVDGAHAPGMLPLNLGKLGATYYTGNCHKWLCGPKSSAFLYVAADKQAGFHPLVLSHGIAADNGSGASFREEFDWMGTVDPSPFLTAAQGLTFFAEQVPGGWQAIYQHNQHMCCQVQAQLCALLRQPLPVPPAMLGSLCSVPVPTAWFKPGASAGQQLNKAWFDQYQIDIPFFPNPTTTGWLMRASCPLYLELQDFEPLFTLIAHISN